MEKRIAVLEYNTGADSIKKKSSCLKECLVLVGSRETHGNNKSC